MKILIIDEEFPYPLNTGKRIRSHHLASGLAQRHQVSYLAYGDPESDGCRHAVENGLQPVPVPRRPIARSGPRFYAGLGLNLLSKYPYNVDAHYSDIYRQRLGRCLDEFHPDVLLCEWTPYARFCLDLTNVPRVVVAHNIEARIWQRYAENESNPVKRWYMARQGAKMERFESEVFRRFEGATAVSDGDAASIRAINPRLKVEVVDNGVDLEYFLPAETGPGSAPPKVVFTGSMDWRPNQDAVRYFVEKILPALRVEIPEIQVLFVGRNPSADLLRMGKTPGVTVTGTVDDVRPYISSAAVYIVPLRIGGGSRLKILEALAMAKPVVSTPVGAEGLEVVDNEHLVLAESPSEWARALVRLFRTPDERARLGSAGRALVERRYSWPQMVGKLELFLESVMAAR